MKSPEIPSFTFIVTACNEEKNLAPTVDEITTTAERAGVCDYEIIIIDDGSTDDTAAVAEGLAARYDRIRILRNASRMGVGRSFLSGAAEAAKGYCLIVPGDNEFDLGFFPEAVSILREKRSSFIVTYVENPEIRPLHRRIFSSLYINTINILFFTGFRYTNGVVIYPTEWIRPIRLRSTGYTFQSEALIKAHGEGKNFAHLGMRFRPREYGKSKIFAIGSILEILISLLRMRIGKI